MLSACLLAEPALHVLALCALEDGHERRAVKAARQLGSFSDGLLVDPADVQVLLKGEEDEGGEEEGEDGGEEEEVALLGPSVFCRLALGRPGAVKGGGE